MTPRLSPAEIAHIRERLERSRAAKGTGDEVALDYALARDACALSAHCADVAASRAHICRYNFPSGASYFPWSDGRGWGFGDEMDESDGAAYSRVAAARATRALGPERERAYEPLDEDVLAAIAARAKELLETTSMATRADATKALANHLPALLAHAASLDDDVAVIESIFFPALDEVSSVERDEETGSFTYEDCWGTPVVQLGHGRGLDFDEALRRAMFVVALPEGATDVPEWLRIDRADGAERERIEEEEWARENAEAARVRAEEERVAAAERDAEYRRLKVVMKPAKRDDGTREFKVSQAGVRAKVRLWPREPGDDRESATWSVTIDEAASSRRDSYGAGKTPGEALRDAVRTLAESDPKVHDGNLRPIDWNAALEAIEAFGPFPTAEEVRRTTREHGERMRALATKLTPDLTRVLAEHGLVVDFVSAGDWEGPAEVTLRLKEPFPR